MAILENMMKLNIYHYSILVKNMKEFLRELDLIMWKSIIPDVCSHKYIKIKINADNYLSLEKTMKMYNVVTLIKSFFIKTHSHYCYQILSKKCPL